MKTHVDFAVLVWLVIGLGVQSPGCSSNANSSSGASAGAAPHGGNSAAGSSAAAGSNAALAGGGSSSAAAGSANSGAAGALSAGASAGGTAGASGSSGAAGAAAASGSAGSAGSPTSGCAGLFCENFESGQVDSAKWDTQTMGGTLEIQQQQVAHGKYAVHFHGLDLATAKTSDYAFLIAKSLPAALETHLFGRANFYITPAPKSGHTGMFWAGSDGFPKPTYEEVANIGGGWQLGYVKLMGSPTDEKVEYPQGKVPAMAWTCIEWEFNDQPDMMTLWVEGKQLGVFDDQHIDYPAGHTPGSPISNGKSSGLVGGFVHFGVGMYDWHPQNAFDLYFDDIVLDTKRVGCLAGAAQ